MNSFATTILMRTTGLATVQASPIPSTSKMISALPLVDRFGYRRSITAKTKRFSFFRMRVFATEAGANGTAFTIPTPEMYNGDFSKWVTSGGAQIPIYDPTTQVTNANGTVTRMQFAGNQVPKSLFSPAALKALSVFQSSGTLTPNTGAAPGTVAYVANNYLETKRHADLSGEQVEHQGRPSVQRKATNFRLLWRRSRTPDLWSRRAADVCPACTRTTMTCCSGAM